MKLRLGFYGDRQVEFEMGQYHIGKINALNG